MLRVTVELIPYGLEQFKQHIGTAEIWNDGTGSKTTGNYKFRLSENGNENTWKLGSVSGFKRVQDSVWDLLCLCLRSTLEGGGQMTSGNLDVQQWTNETAARYPEVLSVHLIGSRANRTAKEHSDFDFIVCLSDDCYKVNGFEIEKKIAEENWHKDIDIYWLRPGGSFGNWPVRAKDTTLLEADESYSCHLSGDLFAAQYGMWERLYISRAYAERIFEREAGLSQRLFTERHSLRRALLVDLRRILNLLNIFWFFVAASLKLKVSVQIFAAPYLLKLKKGRIVIIHPDPRAMQLLEPYYKR